MAEDGLDECAYKVCHHAGIKLILRAQLFFLVYRDALQMSHAQIRSKGKTCVRGRRSSPLSEIRIMFSDVRAAHELCFP